MRGKNALDALCVCIVLLTLLSCASAFVQAGHAVMGNAIPTAVPQVPHMPGMPLIFPSPTATPASTVTPLPTEGPRVFHSETPLEALALIFVGGVAIYVMATDNKHKK